LFVSVCTFVQPVPAQYVLVDVAHAHTLPLQTESLEAHALPQPPQLALSEVSLTQAPLQQLVPTAHTRPHTPQLLLSLLVFVHAVPHAFGVDPEQERAHEPPEQVPVPVPDVGPAQTLPQAPQLLAFVFSSRQAVPQRFGVGFEQLTPHTPFAHVAMPVPDVGAEQV
jgi:hypothetical protein